MNEQIDPEIAYRELQVQYEMLRQRNLIVAQQLANAVKRIKELESADDGASE